ncbi:MAG: acetate--CoA ligase family protein [Thermodesulfobacteriota bacterium]
MEIIHRALKEGRTLLSEYEAKQVLAAYGLPVTREVLIQGTPDLRPALNQVGYPLVLKGCSAEAAHKTEMGLIRVDIRNQEEAEAAAADLFQLLDGRGGILVQEMVKGQRELVVGLTRDPQFGPSVMFGLGGIFTEILRDVSFRVAPLEMTDALEMMGEIRGRKILETVRGMAAADLDTLSRMLIQVGRIGLENEVVREIDINPVILTREGRPVAVDALVVLDKES